MIQLDKKYRTRNGREVRIYAVDGGRGDEVHGAFLLDGFWALVSWRKNGAYLTGSDDTVFDLIEVVPERPKMKAYINKMGVVGFSGGHSSILAYGSDWTRAPWLDEPEGE